MTLKSEVSKTPSENNCLDAAPGRSKIAPDPDSGQVDPINIPSKMDPVAFRARACRRQLRLSQVSLSHLLHQMGIRVSRDVIANWETARGTIPGWQVPFLARCLHVNVTTLLPDFGSTYEVTCGRPLSVTTPTREEALAVPSTGSSSISTPIDSLAAGRLDSQDAESAIFTPGG